MSPVPVVLSCVDRQANRDRRRGRVKTMSNAPRRGKLHLAQGNALRVIMDEATRPVRAKAFILNAFALTGRIDGDVWITQGVLA